MKRFLITAAALTLVGAPAAFAQQQNQNNQNNPHNHGQNQSGGQGGHQSNNSGQGQGLGAGANRGGGSSGVGSGGPQSQGRQLPLGSSQGQSSGAGGQGNSAQWRAGAFQGRGGNPPPNAGPGRGAPPSFHQNIPAPHRYRAPSPFRWPQGFAYRRFSYGDYLPGIFLGQNYWLYDYANYDLPYPPPGAFWVRYGPDALLVDRHTGEVDEVIYGVFY